MDKGKVTYKDAGVDIEAGNEAVRRIKFMVESTHGLGFANVISGIGGFSAGVELWSGGPVITGATDGVGTKIIIATLMNKLDTVGIDLVAMCANDVITDGSRPLFFLDYYATGKQIPEITAGVLRGIVEGCRQAEMPLIGGEMAELPRLYRKGDFDLAGFCAGFCKSKKDMIMGKNITAGDRVYGLSSSGINSNGYSLVRKVFGLTGNNGEIVKKLAQYYLELGRTLGEELIEPTRIYVTTVLNIISRARVNGMVHITGGGWKENPPRILPDGLAMRVNPKKWRELPIFSLVRNAGLFSKEEMRRVFNLGIGFLIVSRDRIDQIYPEALEIGKIVESPTKETQFAGD